MENNDSTVNSDPQANASDPLPAKDQSIMDVLFVIDATGSMGSAIKAAHDRAASIASTLKAKHPLVSFKFGSVCYRDPVDSPSDVHCSFPFDSNIDNLVKFFDGVKPDGGGDHPEDWVGGFEIALHQLKWRSGGGTIVWIADAPAHGKIFCPNDSHPQEGPLLIKLIEECAKRGIVFTGLSIGGGADSTFNAMKPIYEAASPNEAKFSFESFDISFASRRSRVAEPKSLRKSLHDHGEKFPDHFSDEEYDSDDDSRGVPPRRLAWRKETSKEITEKPPVFRSKWGFAPLDDAKKPVHDGDIGSRLLEATSIAVTSALSK